MKMMNKVCALVLSVALCAGMAAPAFAYGGEPVEEVEQPVLTSTTDEEDVVTVTDEENGALTPEGNLTLVDDYHTSYSDGSGQQFITLVSKSGNTFYLVIDRNAKGENTVHFTIRVTCVVIVPQRQIAVFGRNLQRRARSKAGINDCRLRIRRSRKRKNRGRKRS